MGSGVKLVQTLYDKEDIVLHHANLQQYLKLGLRLKKIFRVLQFKQKPWLQPYVDLNTRLRTQATSEAAKNVPKLMVRRCRETISLITFLFSE